MDKKSQQDVTSKQYNRQLLGFTLFELLVTVAIMSIITLMAYPSIMNYLANSEARRIRLLLHNNIKLAKATSYTHRKRVFMCLTDKTGNCHRDGDESILLFFDQNGDNNFKENDGDSLISKQALNLKYGQVDMRAGRRHYVRFASDTGMPRGFFGHFKYCPTGHYNDNMYQLSFNQVGIVRFKPHSTRQPTGC